MSTFTPSAEQAAIIDAPVDADVLVVAGAGSGKTFTMTQRIIALINRGVAPERILGLTFTRKAAGELLERVSAAVAGDMAGSTTATVSDRAFLKPAIFTYDAFFQTIVRQIWTACRIRSEHATIERSRSASTGHRSHRQSHGSGVQ